MSRAALPCVSFREAYYIPTFSKWQVRVPARLATSVTRHVAALQGNITAGVSASVDDSSCIDALPLGITGPLVISFFTTINP